MKTEIISLRQPGGSYDGKCTIVRNVSDEMVFSINSGSIRMKDGRLITSGSIFCDGLGIGSSLMGAVIRFVNPYVVFEAPIAMHANLNIGFEDECYEIVFLDGEGGCSIQLYGTSGNAHFKGGLNVGSASGAGDGDGNFSDRVTATSFTDGIITWTAAQLNRPGNKIELQYGATPGSSVRVGGGGSYPITLDANNGDASGMRSLQIANYSGGKPAASAALRGKMVYEYGGVGVADKIYICMKDTGDGYQWVLLKEAP